MAASRSRLRTRRWLPWHTGLSILAAASAVLTLWGLQLGQRSEYYASIALSMSESWSNFLFGAVDPAGTVSLDKIPGSFWVPAAFVRLFGFSTWSVDAPNAIATVVAVVLVAVTAKRLLGPTAGLIAGAMTATTPILVAVARSNQPESFFVLALALVAWAAGKAVQRGSFRWLMITGGFVALAFQTYMLEAWAVWPALALAYLFVPKPFWKKLREVVIAGVTSLALSLVWILVVFLTPASARPYVGGTYGNNPFEMVFGYNGLGRFSATSDSTAYRSFTPPFSGSPGLFRLFDTQLAGQVAWMLPVAVLAIVVLLVLKFNRAVTVFLGAWFVTLVAMFSVVAGMHQFYTAALAVPVGLLVGLAVAQALTRRVLWAQLALVGAASATALGIAFLYPSYLLWVAVVQVVLAVLVCALLVLSRPAGPLRRLGGSWWVSVLLGASLVLTPAAWSLDAMNHPSSINPVAGDGTAVMSFGGGSGFGGAGRPGSSSAGVFGQGGTPPQGAAPGGGGAPAGTGTAARDGGARTDGGAPGGFGGASFGGAGGASGVDEALLSYLQANRGTASYLLATFGAQAAASYITATDGDSVLPIGGFDGSDPVPTLAAFQQLVSSGQLRFVLVSGSGGGNGFGGGGATASTGSASEIRSWVTATCTAVTDSSVSSTGLYSCAP